jgi:integrase
MTHREDRHTAHTGNVCDPDRFWSNGVKCSINCIPISSALRYYLDGYKQRLTPERWFFPSPQGKRYDPDNFSRDLRNINKKTGLKWTCLDFRHTFGSQLAMKGESLYKISALMGNSPEICRRHYAALIPETMVNSVEFVQIDNRTKQVSA